MSPSKPLNLPHVPPPLKSILPFLQRAEEVRSQDAVIAYWCAYYAAQLGISLKARDSDSRKLLFDLLGVLERMKEDIGPNDAVDVEVASVAYVENFALKVFAVADNEDRRGHANKSTAKKFLASANFFEVLKIFPKAELSGSNEEKIRYAKWKAADIAKAFREGRKPIPGPAGSDEPSPQENITITNTQVETTPTVPHSPPRSWSPPSPSNRRSPTVPISPPPLDDSIYGQEPHTPQRHTHLVPGIDATPETWSTVATPGTAQVSSRDGEWNLQGWEESPLRDRTPNWGNEDLHATVGDGILPYETNQLEASSLLATDSPIKKSNELAMPGSSESGSSAGYVESPDGGRVGDQDRSNQPDIASLPRPNILPAPKVSRGSPLHSAFVHVEDVPIRTTPSVAPVPPADVKVELTPGVIAKAQKHSRFAISALDYEDLEQAKKELRTALGILGGR